MEAVERVDLGDVNGRTYAGIASCGFDSVANRIANETRIVRGNLVYAYGLVRALATWEPATFTVELDGGTRTFRGYSVAAANSKFYGGGMMLAPEASLSDGALDDRDHLGRVAAALLAARADRLPRRPCAPAKRRGDPLHASTDQRLATV